MASTNKAPNMDELAKALEDARAAYEAGIQAVRAEEAKKAEAEMRSSWVTVANAFAPVATAVDAGDVEAVAEAMGPFSKSVSSFAQLIKPFTRTRGTRASSGGNGNGTRSGGLRDLVEETLKANPDMEYTGSSMGQALDRSSGACANALEKLAELGVAVQTNEKPRRYRLA